VSRLMGERRSLIIVGTMSLYFKRENCGTMHRRSRLFQKSCNSWHRWRQEAVRQLLDASVK